MLAFGIRYLNGFVTARAAPDRQDAEWPPHPARVFMALAAAHFVTGADRREREALNWLESLEKDGEPAAPNIVAGDAMHRAVVTHFVPVNDKAGPAKALLQSVSLTRGRQERTFTRAWLADDTVFLFWPDAEPNTAIRSALVSLCGKVTRIGHSSSLVQMWAADEDEIGEPTWVPDEDRAIIRLRIASPGTLEYLERQFNDEAVERFDFERFTSLTAAKADSSNRARQKEAKSQLNQEFPHGPPVQLRPSLSVDHGFARPLPPEGHAMVAGSVFSPYLVILKLIRKAGPYRYLDLGCVPALIQGWRKALISRSNDLPAAIRAILSGHDANGAPLQSAHLAFVPLAFVGHEHADGHLLGMGIALPGDISRETRRTVLRAVGRVHELRLGRLGVWHVKTETQDRPPMTLRSETWTAHPNGAAQWATVTPIAFDYHPKAKEASAYQAEVAAMIGRCCTRLKLPAPREVIVTPVSAHIGAPPAHTFLKLRRKDGSQRRHVHAILVFDAPVCGPVILGAGRFRGYGLCRPLVAFPKEV